MERYEAAHLGGFRKIYPREDSEKYDKYFKHSGSLFQETAASRAREECARQQLQELRVKQEQRVVLQKSRRADLQGESAGERAKPWKAARQAGRERGSLRSSLSHCGKRAAGPVQGRPLTQPPGVPEEEEREREEEEEERERLSALLRREALLREMGVVEQVYRLLQGPPNADSHRNNVGHTNLTELRGHRHSQGATGLLVISSPATLSRRPGCNPPSRDGSHKPPTPSFESFRMHCLVLLELLPVLSVKDWTPVITAMVHIGSEWHS
ncbi:Tubulin polyglutamylase ttll6 [Acipenser ruthenus]|uniref:Tubulin polyglutamylase ttll6 n=1 Tax=Acipenser ruthenus TaxID=7906 RepID=A0A444UHW8_ACIRT|nr:Tubulin polyglutamylase ttll6 [Acipenser ruthenus]